MDRLLCPWDFPGKNTGVGCHFLLQGIFLTQGSNPGLPPCRQTLYHLSHQGSPNIKADRHACEAQWGLERAALISCMGRCLRWPVGSVCPPTSWSLSPSGLSLNDVLVSVSCHNKVPQTRWLKHTYFSQFQGWKSKIRFLVRAQFLACRWLPSHCVPTWGDWE